MVSRRLFCKVSKKKIFFPTIFPTTTPRGHTFSGAAASGFHVSELTPHGVKMLKGLGYKSTNELLRLAYASRFFRFSDTNGKLWLNMKYYISGVESEAPGSAPLFIKWMIDPRDDSFERNYAAWCNCSAAMYRLDQMIVVPYTSVDTGRRRRMALEYCRGVLLDQMKQLAFRMLQSYHKCVDECGRAQASLHHLIEERKLAERDDSDLETIIISDDDSDGFH